MLGGTLRLGHSAATGHAVGPARQCGELDILPLPPVL